MEEAPQDEGALLERISCLRQRQQSESQLHQLLDKRAALAQRRSLLTQAAVAEQLERDKAVLFREVAARDFEVTKGRVDLLRWRQKAALLKVQLSSAEEDVRRCQRVGDILQQQQLLEKEASAAALRRAATQGSAAVEAAQQAAQHSQRAESLHAELAGAQAELEESERRLAGLQQHLERSSKRAGELERQLEAAQLEKRELEKSVAAQEAKVAAVQQGARQLKEENAQLERQRSEAEAATAQQQAAAVEAHRRAEALEQEVATKASEVASLQSRLSAEEKLVLELRAQLDNKRARITELEEEAAVRTVGAFVSQLESPAAEVPRPGWQGQGAALAAVGLECTAAAVPAVPHASADTQPLQQHQESTKGPEAARKGKAAGNAAGQRKRKSKQAAEVEQAAAASGHGSDGEAPAAGAAGRARRDRRKAAPYWLGEQHEELEAGAIAGEQPAAQEQSALDFLADAAAGADASAGAEHPAAAADAAKAEAGQPGAEAAAGEAEGKVAKQQLVEEGPRKRSRRGKAQAEPADKNAAQVGDENAPLGEAKAQKGKGRKGEQLKRPQGEIKTNLTNVWGGATPVPLSSDGKAEQGAKAAKLPRKSKLGPIGEAAAPQEVAAAAAAPVEGPEAAGSSQYRWLQQGQAGGAGENNAEGQRPLAGGSQSSAAAPQPPEVSSRVLENPLGALNQRTLAAAANRLHRPGGPIKSTLQKAIAARVEHSQQQQQQPQKRRLLPVTNGFATSGSGEAVPTNALFGGQFKVPRLAK